MCWIRTCICRNVSLKLEDVPAEVSRGWNEGGGGTVLAKGNGWIRTFTFRCLGVGFTNLSV